MEVRTCAKPLCYLCGSQGKYLYLNTKDQTGKAPGQWNVKQCNNPDCGLCWLDPMPLVEDIGKLYSNYYTHFPEPLKEKNQFVEQSKYFLKSLLTLIPTLDRDKIMADYRYLQGVKPGKLLDIGCGNGSFLQEMQRKGWEVVGIDFDQAAVNVTKQRGIEAYVGDLSTITFPKNSFDAITLNHVIEHLYDPLSCLRSCHNLLRDGGKLTLITPNIESLGHKHFKQYWRGLETPRHLFLFSPKTLRSIAIQAGFSQIKCFSVISIRQIISPGILEASLRIELKNTTSKGLLANNKYRANFLALQELILKVTNNSIGECVVLLAQK
mgnify:CR=1 FL=1